MPICEFCKTELSDKSSLNNHQRTSKYCIKLRENNKNAKEIEHVSYDCEFCKKELSSKYRLNSHLTICKIKRKQDEGENNKIKEIEEQMNKLSQDLIQLKEKPSTTNIIVNNTDNSTNKTITTHNYASLLDFSPESVTESFKKHYNSIEHLLKSDQKQLANMTIEHFLSGKDQPMYYITDRSRNKFMYTDGDNNEKEDANAGLLRKLVYKGLKPIINNLYKEEIFLLNNELKKYQRKDDGVLIASTRDDIKKLEESYQKTNILKESDDYISQLSKCLPSSIKDRIYRDNIDMDDDEEDLAFQLELQKEMRSIGQYTANELKDYKRQYKETGIIRGPKDIESNKKDLDAYIAFLKED